MKYRRIVLITLGVVCFLAGTMIPLARSEPQGRANSQPSIHGVWRVVEVDHYPADGWTSHPTPGFWIFSAKHYAAVAEGRDDVKRPVIEDVGHATAQQLRAAWAPFVAQFGTYEVKGDVLTLKILEAKNIDLIGVTRLQRFKLDANTLTTEPLRDQDGKLLSKRLILKLVRIE